MTSLEDVDTSIPLNTNTTERTRMLLLSIALGLLVLVVAALIWAVRILIDKLNYKEETIKELHNVIDDFKYEMLTRPERIVYKESLTTPKPQVCKRCVDQMIIQAKQQALNNAQSNGMIGTLKGDINSLQGKLSGMGGNGGRSTYEDPLTGLRMYW